MTFEHYRAVTAPHLDTLAMFLNGGPIFYSPPGFTSTIRRRRRVFTTCASSSSARSLQCGVGAGPVAAAAAPSGRNGARWRGENAGTVAQQKRHTPRRHQLSAVTHHGLGHRQGAFPHLDAQEELVLGVSRGPRPLGDRERCSIASALLISPSRTTLSTAWSSSSWT
jgi:hypothetical protein